MNKKVLDPAYQDRVIQQSLMWVNGHSKHNMIDDECVPDCSCCSPETFIDELRIRQRVHEKLVERIRRGER